MTDCVCRSQSSYAVGTPAWAFRVPASGRQVRDSVVQQWGVGDTGIILFPHPFFSPFWWQCPHIPRFPAACEGVAALEPGAGFRNCCTVVLRTCCIFRALLPRLQSLILFSNCLKVTVSRGSMPSAHVHWIMSFQYLRMFIQNRRNM